MLYEDVRKLCTPNITLVLNKLIHFKSETLICNIMRYLLICINHLEHEWKYQWRSQNSVSSWKEMFYIQCTIEKYLFSLRISIIFHFQNSTHNFLFEVTSKIMNSFVSKREVFEEVWLTSIRQDSGSWICGRCSLSLLSRAGSMQFISWLYNRTEKLGKLEFIKWKQSTRLNILCFNHFLGLVISKQSANTDTSLNRRITIIGSLLFFFPSPTPTLFAT
jgi:hypothetical protein